MIDLIDKIDEIINKPSFEEFFLNKKNKRMIEKIWQKDYNELAMQYGEESMDDPQLYGSYRDEETGEFDMEVDPIEAYEDFAVHQGYPAEYEASSHTIKHFKNKYAYNKKDEYDEEKQYDLAEYMGYRPSFS